MNTHYIVDMEKDPLIEEFVNRNKVAARKRTVDAESAIQQDQNTRMDGLDVGLSKSTYKQLM